MITAVMYFFFNLKKVGRICPPPIQLGLICIVPFSKSTWAMLMIHTVEPIDCPFSPYRHVFLKVDNTLIIQCTRLVIDSISILLVSGKIRISFDDYKISIISFSLKEINKFKTFI